MVKCGIEKYDALPGRVGWIDVDMNRWVLYLHENPLKCWSWPVIGKTLKFLMLLPHPSKEDVTENLERAYKRHRLRGEL